MGAVYKRELRSYFQNMTGFVIVAFLLAMTGLFSTSVNFAGGYPNFEYALGSVSFVMLFVVPILTMRSLAEERRQKTDLFMFSLPQPVYKIILGKYFAMLTVLAIPVGVMMLYPLILSLYGTVHFVSAYSAIFGFFLMGAALIAIGLFMSSLTESQVIAAVLSFGAMLVCYMMTGIASLVPTSALASFLCLTAVIVAAALILYLTVKNYWLCLGVAFVAQMILVACYMTNATAFVGVFGTILGWLSLFERLDSFIYTGVFDLTSVVYYLSVCCVFVLFTVQSVDKRRWN